MGMVVIILWGIFLLFSFVIAGAIAMGHNRKRKLWATMTVLGGFLSYAWVSVILGFLEVEGYSKTVLFVVTVGVGVLSMALFIGGARHLKS